MKKESTEITPAEKGENAAKREGSEEKLKIEYLLGGWNPQMWEGTMKEAMQIALAEIHEHAGGSSPAYTFTKKIFDKLLKK